MPSHLTLEERDLIAELRHRGFNQQEIARAIRRCPSTLSRELRRNCTGEVYRAAQAQRKSERRRRERPLTRKLDEPAFNLVVRQALRDDWSPEQIAGRMKERPDPAQAQRRVSPQTIYTWIENDEHREHWESRLRRRGKRRCRRKTAAPSAAARIKNRPEVIEARLRFGDFEGDTVLKAAPCSARPARAASSRSSIANRGSPSSPGFSPRTPTTCMRESSCG